jgi:hypothetical protein
MVLCCGYVAVTQNALNHRIIHEKTIQVRSQSSAESMPTVPGKGRDSESNLRFVTVTSRAWHAAPIVKLGGYQAVVIFFKETGAIMFESFYPKFL